MSDARHHQFSETCHGKACRKREGLRNKAAHESANALSEKGGKDEITLVAQGAQRSTH